jgi:hypothetical protein
MWERWLGVLSKVFNAPPLYLSYLNLFLRLKYYYLGIGSQRRCFEEGQLLPSLKAPPLHIALLMSPVLLLVLLIGLSYHLS